MNRKATTNYTFFYKKYRIFPFLFLISKESVTGFCILNELNYLMDGRLYFLKMKSCVFLLFFLFSSPVMGTHLLGGYLNYQLTEGNNVNVTVYLLTETNSIQAGLGTLSFGDGSSFFAGIPDFTVEPLGFNLELVSFSVNHTYAEPGNYKISYWETNYTDGIHNITNSVDIPFYIETTLVITSDITENQSPILNLFQGQRGLSGVRQHINPAPFDPDNDSLSFKIIVPGFDNDSRISSYSYPNDTSFYKNFFEGNEDGNGTPVYSINASTGEIVWDAPELIGEYVIAYAITQWRKYNDEWVSIGVTEVVLNDIISDGNSRIDIEKQESQCYNNIGEVNTRFLLTASDNEEKTVKIFTNLPASSINNISVEMGNHVEFSFTGELTLEFNIPDPVNLIPYHLYRVIVQVETEEIVQSSSWAFAIGCVEMPGELLPDPIDPNVPEEPAQGFLVYPNPSFQNFVYVRLPENSDRPRKIRIFDVTGKIHYNRERYYSEKIIDFDISGLSSGMYIIQVDHYLQKFLKLH